ncbi:ABC transporter substrate-binding protein [Papillibacter cinnamivorans]|uniref:Branched-chain amino acid transport system substrate-binding protein n=1 Tax=Papillibacter cinnamivorans DSM 12816 TaxID=1122930 RepID=A0A1W2A471_9FIRM|nr:ABC transporter substrate-binding protein [Papillibacter cinnamivorans]SMC55373.1 branched-chain amino acid transport system substrate-binding protein [Papillibacter cinnamivorans DSM 12816]
MKKKGLLALALALALCIATLAGCSGGGTAATPTPTAAAPQTIKIGCLAPLTGNVAVYGIAARNGAKLYIDEVNAAGGINGKQIEFIEYDEKGDATEAVNAYNKLVDDGVTAIIGDVTSKPTIAVAQISVEDNMPMISGTATAADVTSYGNNMFRSCFLDPFQGTTMAKFAQEKLGATKVAVIYNTGDDYSKGLAESFTSTATELGMTVVASEGYATGDVDFTAQLTNITTQKPDVLLCPDYYNTVVLIAQQAKSVGLTATLLGCDGWDGVLTVTGNDASAVEGAYFCNHYSTADTSELVQNFLKNYEAAYGETANAFAATTYDAAKILLAGIQAAEDAGLTAGTAEYKQAVIDAMDKTDMDCVTGHITFDENNNPIKSCAIIKIVNGAYSYEGQF